MLSVRPPSLGISMMVAMVAGSPMVCTTSDCQQVSKSDSFAPKMAPRIWGVKMLVP